MMNNKKVKTSVPLKGLKVTQIVHAIAILVLLVLAAATSIKTGHYLFDSASVFILSLALVATAALIPITFRSINSERRRRSMLKRYEAVVKSANDAIFLVSHDQFIVEANERASLMYGYAAEEFLGLKIADLRIPKAAKLIDSDLSNVNAINTKLIETIHRKKDGTVFPVEVSVQRLELDQKQYFMGIVRDVTERKRVEEELRQSRSLLNAVIQGTLDCVFVKDLTGRYVLMNEALFKVLGKRDEEVIGKTDFEIFSEKEAVQMFQIDQETLQRGTIQAFEEEVEMPDGRHSYLTIKGPVRDSAGIIIGLFGIARDITARTEHEEQLRKLQLAVDQSPASIMITDAQGKIEYVNRRFTEVTQYESHEVLGSTPRVLKSGITPPETYAELWQTISAGNDWRGELCNKKKNGDVFWESSLISPVRNGDGRITHFIAVKEDITARRHLEAQLFHAQRLESIGTLAGGIAHDLNNVLAPILTSVELLKERSQPGEEQDLLTIAEMAALRGKQVVQQVLSFARQEETKSTDVQPVDLLSEIDALVRQTFPRSIEKSVRMSHDVWSVRGDATQLLQALMNLCVNARDAMRESRGKLEVGVENIVINGQLSSKHVCAKPGNYVHFWVSDTGTGIPQDIQARIFDPFFTTKDIGKGTGLGLSTTYAIVQNHNGFIDLKSEAGKGSTFSIFLPAIVRFESRHESKPTKVFQARGEGVLVVDDEPSIRNVLKMILETHGFKAFVAEGGNKAIELFCEHMSEIQVVITDWMMPDMDGAEIIHAIRQIHPGVKIIVSTGLMEMGPADNDDTAGVSCVLMKPYRTEIFLETLMNLLDSPPVKAGTGTEENPAGGEIATAMRP